MRKFWKKTEGFTLVELIVVIAILGILAGVGTVGYSGYVKKANMAADEQLLAYLNQAFQAACIEHGENYIEVNADGITIGDDKKVEKTDIVVINPVAKAEVIQDAFEKYYGEGGAFKVMTSLYYSNGQFHPTGRFDASTTYTFSYAGSSVSLSGADLQALANSAFATDIGAKNLMDMVDAAAGLIEAIAVGENPTSSDLYNLAYSSEAKAYLLNSLGLNNEGELEMLLVEKYPYDEATYGNSDAYNEFMANKFNEIYANSAVLYAATSTQAASSGFMDILKADNVKETIKSTSDPATQMAQSAMAFAMYSAYKGNASLGNVDLTDVYATLDSDDFKEYLEENQAQADLNGYLSSMNMISSSVSGANEAAVDVLFRGFNNDELVSLLGQIAGK